VFPNFYNKKANLIAFFGLNPYGILYIGTMSVESTKNVPSSLLLKETKLSNNSIFEIFRYEKK